MIEDYINLKFGDKWASEMNLTVVINGDRHTPSIFGEFENRAVSVPGRMGAYYYGTDFRTKQFNVFFAFDDLKEYQLNEIKAWLEPNKIKKLILNDHPYKYYCAKVSTPPEFSYIPFDENKVPKKLKSAKLYTDIYKGELSVTFEAYDPRAYSDYEYFTQVEADAGINYMQTFTKKEKVFPIWGWVQGSNLFRETEKLIDTDGDGFGDTKVNIFNSLNIWFKTTDFEVIEINDNTQFVNSGTINASIKMSFDLPSIAIGQVLQLDLYQYHYATATRKEEPFCKVQIQSFENYRPFKRLMKLDNNLSNWQMIIDSDKCEIYIEHKEDNTKKLNLSQFNTTHNFLEFLPSGTLDYELPFYSAYEGNVNGKLKTAPKDIHTNLIKVNRQLTNVRVEYRHTYL